MSINVSGSEGGQKRPNLSGDKATIKDQVQAATAAKDTSKTSKKQTKPDGNDQRQAANLLGDKAETKEQKGVLKEAVAKGKDKGIPQEDFTGSQLVKKDKAALSTGDQEAKALKKETAETKQDRAAPQDSDTRPYSGQTVTNAATAGTQNITGAQAATPTAPTAKIDAAEMATQMLDRLAAGETKGGAKVVSMTFNDSVPQLKGTQVEMRLEGNKLVVKFDAPDQATTDLIGRNLGNLKTEMENKMQGTNVLFENRGNDEEGGQNRESRGEYIPEADDLDN